MKTTSYLLLGCLLLQGCANAVSYHHLERFSVATLESTATDPTQPIQGNIGAKVRTVLVTPGKKTCTVDNDTSICKPGESMSVVSDFDLRRKGNGAGLATTEITSAFLTGEAAIKAPPATKAAIGGFGEDAIGTLSVNNELLLRGIYAQLTALATSGDKTAEAHKAALDKLAALLPDAASIAKINHYTAPVTGKDYSATTGFTLASSDFNRVIDYEIELRGALATIEAIRADREITLGGEVIDAKAMKDIDAAYESLAEMRSEFSRMIGSSPVIDNAVLYVTSRL